MTNPILVEVLRGGEIESFHRGSVCIANADGNVLEAWGDVETPVCPRSSIKPFQALPLLESGAAQTFALTDAEVALACASHAGSLEHTDRVAAWLIRVGLTANDLECGAHMPSDDEASKTLIRAGMKPTALHNNCSGKHTGFLTLAQHLGAPTLGYTKTSHPVQQDVLRAIGNITGCDADTFHTVCDGCSAPNIFLPLRALATGWARLANRSPRIAAAMKAYPLLVAGAGRPCTKLIEALAGRGFVKTGAEGVYAAAIPEQNIGIAVKIDDGAGRAAVIAITAALDHLRAFKPGARDAVEELKRPVITAWAGAKAGVMRPATGWLT